MSSYDYKRELDKHLRHKAALEAALKREEEKFYGLLVRPKDNAINKIDTKNVYNYSPAPMMAHHLLAKDIKGRSPDVDRPPQNVFEKIKQKLRDLNETINSLASKKSTNTYIDPYDFAGGKSKKSKKQQRKTKAKKTHRKRTQRK